MTAKRTLWGLLAVVVLAIAGGATYLTLHSATTKSSDRANSASVSPTQTQSKVAASASSKNPIGTSSAGTTQSSTETTNDPPPNPGNISGQPANPSISSIVVHVTGAKWVAETREIEVVSSISGLTAQTGNCTANASTAQQIATASGTAVFDGRGMSCGLMRIAIPASWSGDVNVQVKIATTAGSGVSEKVQVSVS